MITQYKLEKRKRKKKEPNYTLLIEFYMEWVLRAFSAGFASIRYFTFSKSYFFSLAIHFYKTSHILFSILQYFILKYYKIIIFFFIFFQHSNHTSRQPNPRHHHPHGNQTHGNTNPPSPPQAKSTATRATTTLTLTATKPTATQTHPHCPRPDRPP